ETSEHRADDFAADIRVAGVVIGHHALGRRQNGNAKAVIDARQIADRHIDAAAGLGHALDFADHRLAVEILELDLELRAAAGVRYAGIAADEALGLEHLEHAFALPGARHRDLRFAAHLRVTDTRDHVADRIVHCHRALPTSSTSQGPE